MLAHLKISTIGRIKGVQDSFFQKIFLLKISFKKVEETGCSPVWAAAHLFRLPTTQVATICSTTRVAEVVRGNGGPPPKSLDSDENLKPQQKCPFWDQKKWHFEWPNQNSKTTFIVQTFPKYGPYGFDLVNLSLLGPILAKFQFC